MNSWRPDRESHIPLYLQIEQHIKEKILHGEWTIGTKIPSQRKLAEELQVNRSTVTAAVDELIAQGLLEGKRGGGTKVVNNTWSIMAAAKPLDWSTYVTSGSHQPNSSLIQAINQNEPRPDLIRLGTGELSQELLPEQEMAELFREAGTNIFALGYEEPKGSLQLRQSVAEHLKTKGIHASPASIVIVSGALQALQLISIGLLKPNSVMLTENPSYLHSLRVFQSAGVRLKGVPMDGGGIKTDHLPAYRRQYEAGLLYTIPSFHNPTGTVMSLKRRKELIVLARNHRLPVIEDDAYGDLWIDKEPPPPLKSMDGEGNVLYVGTLSKTVSPGLRIGWVVAPEPVADRLADIKMQTDYGSSALSQWAACQWLSSGRYEARLLRLRKELKMRRDAALRFLKRYAGDIAEWRVPEGGFYIWVTFHQAIAVQTLFTRALEAGVLINPGALYLPEDRQSLRLSYSYASLPDLEKGIQTIADIARRFI
ncbi:PLP-dependent aminotransferase family protein [Bacillus velezensis]|uniref:MocR-like pyridoxine biosynthesis transcription factor PdxR n=1 Tax=Bacillus velezensis TaxID=492670 RepID=UPI002DBDCAD3|nr:PLP-dependent aminotransferase family protein [Bacillus velezensis]MEC1384549.1 PLP-dependent aminotransferase family protein [Bacillus velezensis]